MLEELNRAKGTNYAVIECSYKGEGSTEDFIGVDLNALRLIVAALLYIFRMSLLR